MQLVLPKELEEQDAFVTPQKSRALWIRCVISEQEWTQVPEVSVLVGVIE